MARKTDVLLISNTLDMNLSDIQIESIAATTGNNYDIERVIHELGSMSKPTANKMKDLLNAKAGKRDRCGKCHEGWLPIYNRHRPDADYPLLNIPKADTFCPNCGIKPQYLAELITRLTDTEQAWTWVVLYDFLTFQLQQVVDPKDFNPGDYWTGIDMNPALSRHQIQIMNEIYLQAATGRDGETPRIIETCQRVIHDTAEAIQF